MGNQAKEPKFKELKIELELPEDVAVPKYCNNINIQFTPHEYIFNFAFIDPSKVDEDTKKIKARINTRICMNHKWQNHS